MLALTILNLVVTVPLVLEACECYRGGQIFCSGDCCGGSTQCDCYDVGTDNCTKIIVPQY